MTRYISLAYLIMALKYKRAVIGSPAAMVGGWLVDKPSRKAV